MKKNGLFLCCENYDFDDVRMLCIGIAKKIVSQIRVLNTDHINCHLVNLHRVIKNPFIRLIYIFFARKVYIKQMERVDFRLIDFVYIRRFSLSLSVGFICMLKHIKTFNQNCKIMYEIPTYPYDGEHKGFKGFLFLIIDKIFRRKLQYYVDYIVTYSQDDTIWGIETIKIINGIDCSSILPANAIEYRQTAIRLIAVAQFADWHGYDRLIEGLYGYYKNNPEKKIFIDFVGDGRVLQQYREMVSKYSLAQYVVFHGVLTGAGLSAVFNQADIAVCSLGCHRIGIFLGSFLKSREYIARGLPMISSTKIDILPETYPYIQYVPEDDSSIDIESVINFYNMLKRRESRQQQIKNIRTFAENNCDISVTMKPIISELMR